MSETSFVHPSPRLTTHQIKQTRDSSRDSSLRYDQKVKHYHYNPKEKIYEVESRLFLLNNQNQYQLIQFHFHQPAEHLTLEIHFVFQEVKTTGNLLVNLLVLAFLFEETPTWNKTETKSESPVSADSPDLSKFTLITRILNHLPFEIPCMVTSFVYPGSLTLTREKDEKDHVVEWIVSTNILSVNKSDLVSLKPRCKSARAIQGRFGQSSECPRLKKITVTFCC